MRQRSVHMRLEPLKFRCRSNRCFLGADDRDAQEQSLRGPSSPTRVPQFVLGTALVLRFWGRALACKRSFRGALDRWVYLASWQFFFEA